MSTGLGATPRDLQGERFDLVVIGGGIHGAIATLTAARSGRRVLLLEREDFGGATSWNSLRILHGGLRYLQTLDFGRFRESVRSRAWFVREFPELVAPLPCLMPLYGRGLRRAAVMGPALGLDVRLRRRWSTEEAIAMLPAGELLTREAVIDRFPSARTDGLRGGALWYDGLLAQPQRVMAEILRRAAAGGAACVNYLEVTEWISADGRVRAVRGRDTLTFEEYEFPTSAVLNCAGPWAAALGARGDRALAAAFHPSIAFNLLLDRRLDSTVSVAVEPPGGGPTYFLHPMDDLTMAGTVHAPAGSAAAEPEEARIEAFLAALRAAIPDFGVDGSHVLRVMSGVLPAVAAGSAETLDRDLWHAAAGSGGADGVFSVVGVKYTTAPLVAAAAAARALGLRGAGGPGEPAAGEPPTRDVPGWTAFGLWADRDPEAAGSLLDSIVSEERVRRIDDLLLRRTDWGLDPRERSRADARVRQLRPRLFSDGR